MLEFSRMRTDEVSACAALAASAYEHYEFVADYIPSVQRRRRFLQDMMRVELRMNQNRAAMFTAHSDGALAAMAMLCGPDYRRPTKAEAMRAGFWRCLLKGGAKDVAAWDDMQREAEAPCAGLPGAPWFMRLLVVNPAMEGMGIGSRMISECLAPFALERGGDALCVYTNSQGNRMFLERNGFQEFDVRFFDYRGFRLGSWSFIRPLRPADPDMIQ